jgi:hypothetical protein
MRYGSRLACLAAAQQADVQAPAQSASHAAVHRPLPLQQADAAVDSSAMIAANSEDTAVHFADRAGAPSAVVFCFAHAHWLQHLHSSPQAVVADVETAVATTSVDDDLTAASACWQQGFWQLQLLSQAAHSAAGSASQSVPVICSIANTLVAKAVRIKTASVDFMSSSP